MKKTINISIVTILISIFGTAHAEIIQFGKMREALAEGKTESRAVLAEITKKPHFYGVGALEGLKGEVAVIDGDVISTQAISSSEIDTKKQTTPTKATYLVGGYIPEWHSIQTASNLTTKEFEKFVEQTATKNGVSKKEPFMFIVDGKVESAEAHVIRGACPMHARMKKKELSESEKPFETSLKMNDVKIVGVFAKDRVGDLTHPATSIHAHIIYTDSKGNKVNGHLENIVLAKGATVSIPKK